jgi:hypothetical protein
MHRKKINGDKRGKCADTYSNATLDRYGLIINTVHHCLVCVECGCVVDHGKLRTHVMKLHKELNPPKDMDVTMGAMLAECYPKLLYPPKHPTKPVLAIYGLVNAVDGYGVCVRCHKGYKIEEGKGSNAFSKHVCMEGMVNTAGRTWVVSQVQRFENNTRSPYFAVYTEDERLPIELDDSWGKYQEEMAKRPKPSSNMSVPENYRVLDQFLHKEQWLEHVKGFDAEKLTILVAATSNDPDFPKLGGHCEAYLRHHQNTLNSYHARRLISTRPRCVWVKYCVTCFVLTLSLFLQRRVGGKLNAVMRQFN